MEQRDRDRVPDDGIVAEDLTQLVEHIELTSPQRLIDSPEWDMAKPAAHPDDVPLMLEEVDEDPERFTETEFDLTRRLKEEQREPEISNELAAERLRWQRRVERLLMEIEERDQVIAERERQIEELSARLATSSLEREGLATELRETHELAIAPDYAPAQPRVERRPEPEADETRSVPSLSLPAEPRVRHYLIGLDMAGSVLELARSKNSIGRTQDNDLRIVDPTVSRLHATLTVRDGDVTIVDANSRNGIFVNGIQVRFAKLEDGDTVTFGTIRYRYRVGSTGAGEPVAAA